MNAKHQGLEIPLVLGCVDQLPFVSETFDVVVSRNVLSNLAVAKEALESWHKTLKPGGYLIYFDSPWWNYLHDGNLDAKRELAYGTGSSPIFNVLEELAKDMDISSVQRPSWDVAVLSSLGFDIEVVEGVSDRVWNEEEQRRYQFAPQFMVVARKRAWKGRAPVRKMIVQRLIHLVVVLLLVTLVSFFLMYFSSGDPVTALLSRGGTVPDPDLVAQKKAELGLDKPVVEQYAIWLSGVLQGNLGTSISSGRPVSTEIFSRMPATMFLAVVSLGAYACGFHPAGLPVRFEEEQGNRCGASPCILCGCFGAGIHDGLAVGVRAFPHAALAAQHRQHEGRWLGLARVDVGLV